MKLKSKATELLDRFAARIAERVSERLAANGAEVARTDAAQVGILQLDYPFTPRPRWGQAWDLPVHTELLEIIRSADPEVSKHLQTIAAYGEPLARIAEETDDPHAPYWVNGWLPGWDGAAIYAFLADRKPATYLEVGSGNSTKFARRAITDQQLSTRIISIDPHPRAEIDALCDTVIRSALEDVQLELVLSGLASGDVVFIDNSHCAFQNSDVTVTFLELLPRLPANVLIGIHDIFLPDDYPTEWAPRGYNEQYLLATFLLGGHRGTEIILPAFDASRRPELRDTVNAIWQDNSFPRVERHGGAFWLRTV